MCSEIVSIQLKLQDPDDKKHIKALICIIYANGRSFLRLRLRKQSAFAQKYAQNQQQLPGIKEKPS
jgi:hypothetical protein